MRKLNTHDVFNCLRAIKATGAREELQKIYAAIKPGDDEEELGLGAIAVVLESIADPAAERAACVFLAGPLECSPEDVQQMDLEELIAALKQMAEENNLRRFFHSVSGLIGQKSET